MNFENFEGTREFTDLSDFYTKLVSDDCSIKELQTSQKTNLLNKIKSLLKVINDETCSPGSSKLLNVLFSSMSLLFQKPLEINEDNEIKIQKLEEENTDLRNKCNSAKPTLLRSQSAEIEFYKNRISEMEEENKDAIQKIINEIASEVDFDSKLKDKDDLINFIKSNYVDVIKNIKEELELPLDTSNMNLVNALRKSIGLSASKSMIDFKLENDKSNISEKNIEYQNNLT